MNNLKTTSSAVSRPQRLLRLATVAMLLGGAAVGALAQYKIVGPDGKVTYTDKPPTAADIKIPANGGNAAPSAGGLPYETRQAMTKFPVTLYRTKDCPVCDDARRALRQRGVPFNEYTVVTSDDFTAYKSRFNSSNFPTVIVGGKSLSGYSPTDLSGYLDAAGYPAQARLTGYNWPAAVPLVPPRAAPAPANAGVPAPTASAPTSLLPPPSQSGIQF